jgi:hypothetical protein
VQGIRVFPHAFSSLATIADSISNYKNERELAITLDKNIVNSGETFKIFWTEMRANGTYHFGYSCAEEVLVSVRTGDGDFRNIGCTDDLELPKEATGLFIMATSRSQRFSTLTFSLRFDAENGDDHITESRVTIVNATVPTARVLPSSGAEQGEQKTAETQKPVTEIPSVTSKPTQPASAIVSILPQSYESGFTDLKISFSAAGTMSGNSFTPTAAFSVGTRAGLRFTVTNIGTKRSDTWTYAIDLPEGRYESQPQAPLEPNEKALYTIGFDFPESDSTSFTLKGITNEKNDTNTKNNSFSWSVKVTK